MLRHLPCQQSSPSTLLNPVHSRIVCSRARLLVRIPCCAALDVLVVLLVIVFSRYSRRAALCLLPYLGWILFATALTAGVKGLNPRHAAAYTAPHYTWTEIAPALSPSLLLPEPWHMP